MRLAGCAALELGRRTLMLLASMLCVRSRMARKHAQVHAGPGAACERAPGCAGGARAEEPRRRRERGRPTCRQPLLRRVRGASPLPARPDDAL